VADNVPRARLTAVPEAAVLVVRGDALDPAVLRADALRFVRRYPAWGRYGVSAFLAADTAEVDVLCETRLERFATVVVFRRHDLVAAGIEVVPTFRAPHVTLAAAELELLVARLLSCQHETMANGHHQGGD
jgi:hypothetical protein